MTGSIVLAPGKDKPVRQGHPWLFSGAIRDTRGDPKPGDTVDILDERGGWLARGYFNPRSQIVARLLTWDEGERIDDEFWARRLTAAAQMRAAIGLTPKNTDVTGYRLAFAESDLLPGLIVDRYGDWLSVQFLTLGVDVRRKLLTDLL
ncbi:MAG: 23S rRNA (cytosine(1962)-C(5))-methyltransferase RlmI, partial [Anaerolineae bacterium]|nr:23S rRNA (cytosine(1962)-C(5))-methyltransferase RlmI [Anaerolineae bacterium]